MAFTILYVEDRARDFVAVESAVRRHNDSIKPPMEPLILVRAQTTAEVTNLLSLKFDVVITDAYLPATSGQEPSFQVGNILTAVRQLQGKDTVGRLPVIAYTRYGAAALKALKEYQASLFDIWDKKTASAEYVTWRLVRLANELVRQWPDRCIQQCIQTMEPGASWHKSVVTMTKSYANGLNERDQVEKATDSILDIARSIGVDEQCEILWDCMREWEPISRAVSDATRGHTRHVMNVFWMGYLILHSQCLSGWYDESWTRTWKDRRGGVEVEAVSWREGFSATWFLTALFHDVGGPVEKAVGVRKAIGRVLSPYRFLGIAPESERMEWHTVEERGRELVNDYDSSLRSVMVEAFVASVAEGKPDQGVVSASILQELIRDGVPGFYAREAGRSAALHNIIGRLATQGGKAPITWDKEPLGCLLLVCDQLQTWDRERGDETSTNDMPARAELTSFDVSVASGRPIVRMVINYLSPRHVLRSPELLEKTEGQLKSRIRKYPERSLRKISGAWPFRLEVYYLLNGADLHEPFIVD